MKIPLFAVVVFAAIASRVGAQSGSGSGAADCGLCANDVGWKADLASITPGGESFTCDQLKAGAAAMCGTDTEKYEWFRYSW